MQSVLILLGFLMVAALASAFTVSVPSLARPSSRATLLQRVVTPLFSDKKEDEEGLDLDLEEMFTMFEAADKEEDFDKAIKKVKEE